MEPQPHVLHFAQVSASSHCITQQLVQIGYYLNTKPQHIFQQRKWTFYSFNAQKYFSLCIL